MSTFKGGTRTVQSVKDITLGSGYFRIGKTWDEMYDLGAVQGVTISYGRGTVDVQDGSPAVAIDTHVTAIQCIVQTALLEKRLEDMLKVIGLSDVVAKEDAATESKTEIVRLIGTSWAHLYGKDLSNVTVYKPVSAIARIYAMNSNSTSKINDVKAYVNGNSLTAYAVGDGGTILKLSVSDISTVDWDTVAWTAITSGVTANLTGVDVIDADNFVVVGENGTMLYSTDGGSNINTVSTGITYDLNDVIALDVDNFWAVGDNGHIDHFNVSGATYTADARSQITGKDLYSIEHVNDAVLVVGNGYVGTSSDITTTDLSDHTPHTGETYYDGYMKDANVLYIVGAYGVAYKSTNGGYTWNRISSIATHNHLYGVDGNRSNDDVVIVSAGGHVYTSVDGFASSKAPENVNNYDLYNISFAATPVWLLVGDHGTISRLTELDLNTGANGWAEAEQYDSALNNTSTAEVVVDTTYGTVRRYKDTLTSIPSPGRVKVVYQWNKPQTAVGYYGVQNTLEEYKLMFVHTRKDGNREIYKFWRVQPASPGNYGFNPGGFNGYPAVFKVLADPAKPIDRQLFEVRIEGQSIME